MSGLIRAALLILGSLAWSLAAAGQPPARAFDPAGRFSPRASGAIDAGRAVVEIVREPGADLAIAGAVRTTADTGRLLAWFREIELFQRGPYIPLIHRFSSPPRIEDVASLVLDESELDELRSCRPGDCEMKLAATEIAQITAAIQAAGSQWQAAAQHAFRHVLVARAQAYLEKGLAGSPPYDDHDERVVAAEEFDLLLDGCGFTGLRTASIARYLRQRPRAADGRQIESYLFWSRDLLGDDAKPIVGITALDLFPPTATGEGTVVASTQVYASHYINASLSLTAVVQTAEARARYILYGRCTRADVFDGPFGGLIRRMVQKRIRKEGPPVLEGLRRKLESGPPVRIPSSARRKNFPGA